MKITTKYSLMCISILVGSYNSLEGYLFLKTMTYRNVTSYSLVKVPSHFGSL
jgi:hypothetical protein